ncbi:hypothetical protein HX021_13785 [Sphingobacterium sp. N143]|uniref:hypothetical protein n=1 Tax=Sphingobacterium sp. N143 TaxID=2746727 RepID=UPI002574A477|nr:hypothetical protein [Sphingobacterium sp. N143]MDM1295354.1 hypothetical protein [Sphingobacterium sp. N143]
MIETSYQEYKITILEDDQYEIESSDNLREYDQVYFDSSIGRYKVSAQLAILISLNNEEIGSTIICGTGPYAGLTERTFLIEDDHLYICFTDDLYCFSIPNLSLTWKNQIDDCVNFGLQKIENDLLVHGEIEIIRLTKAGDIIWRFAGINIWVNIDGHKEVTVLPKSIKLVDFESNCYELDFDGNIISQNL